MADPDELDFAAELRNRSRRSHRLADAAVHLTAPLALSSRDVYRTSVKAFFHVYRAIEAEMERRRGASPALQAMYFPELRRAAAFERDLAFYYGAAPVGAPSPATAAYLEALRASVEADPLRLVAWCHTMYSALFGGGAVIRTWCSKAFGLQGPDGTRAFDFSGTIPDRPAFRRRYNAALNALPLTREEKEVICAQRQEIFRLNSTLFAEMRASAAYRRRVNACLGCLALVLLACHGLWSALRR